MARAETVTLLSLDRWSEVMRMNNCHFNGVAGARTPLSLGCDAVWSQDDREDLAIAIAEAEEMIAAELGYWPAPTFITNEDVWIGMVRGDWWNAELMTRYGYLENFGTESLTLIQADAPVTYENRRTDPHDREETAVIGDPGSLYTYLSSSCAGQCNVAVFFRVGDGAWDPADPRWEIRNLKADVDGTGLTITGESCMFVKPELWDEVTDESIPFDTDNLVEYVDVYCRTVNTSLPATVKWDGYCTCSSPCAHQTQTACCHVTDRYLGIFTVRTAGADGSYAAPARANFPEKVTVNYRAGYPLDPRTCRINPNLERAIVKLANVLLPEPPCGFCDKAEIRWKRDRENVDPLTTEAAGLPWALYQRGALEAWRIVQKMAIGRGGKL